MLKVSGTNWMSGSWHSLWPMHSSAVAPFVSDRPISCIECSHNSEAQCVPAVNSQWWGFSLHGRPSAPIVCCKCLFCFVTHCSQNAPICLIVPQTPQAQGSHQLLCFFTMICNALFPSIRGPWISLFALFFCLSDHRNCSRTWGHFGYAPIIHSQQKAYAEWANVNITSLILGAFLTLWDILSWVGWECFHGAECSICLVGFLLLNARQKVHWTKTKHCSPAVTHFDLMSCSQSSHGNPSAQCDLRTFLLWKFQVLWEMRVHLYIQVRCFFPWPLGLKNSIWIHDHAVRYYKFWIPWFYSGESEKKKNEMITGLNFSKEAEQILPRMLMDAMCWLFELHLLITISSFTSKAPVDNAHVQLMLHTSTDHLPVWADLWPEVKARSNPSFLIGGQVWPISIICTCSRPSSSHLPTPGSFVPHRCFRVHVLINPQVVRLASL